MVEDRTRHDRLRSLLPRIYATDPQGSALGVLLEVLADRLREADGAIERGQRDKWLLTASGARERGAEPEGSALPTVDLGDRPRPLEHIGAGLDLLRQPWEVDTEAYRGRVRLLAPLLAGGLGTPRAIAAVALSSLGSEPCPVLERGEGETRGHGLPPGSLVRCRTCRGGQRPPAGTPCPRRSDATMSVSVVDNPRRRVVLTRRQLRPDAGGEARIHFDGESLLADRPELVLRVPEDAAGAGVLPRFLSLATGEEMIVARLLGPGDVLYVRGRSPHDPNVPPQRQRWVDCPPNFAAAPPDVRVGDDVDIPVIVSRGGARFDADAFDEGVFYSTGVIREEGGLGLEHLHVPSVVPGRNTWVYQAMGRAEFEAALANLDPTADLAALPDASTVPVEPDTSEVRLELRWWARAPSRFSVRIPRTAAVQAALAVGAADYLRRMIDRVRPLGVLPIIDFVQPLVSETIEPGDRLRAVGLGMREDVDPRDGVVPQGLDLGEAVEPTDGGGFIGMFDVTVFGFSVFSETGAVPGLFDTTTFDYAEFQ